MTLDDLNQQLTDLETQKTILLEQQRQAQLDAVKARWAGDGPVQPTQVTYWQLDYSDIDRLFAQEFGIETEAAAHEEWANFSCYKFVTRLDWYNEYDRHRVAKWLAGDKKWPGVGNLLCELVSRGRLPAGDYLVTVFW